MSHFVKGRDVNWSKAGEENILEQIAGKEMKTSGRVNRAKESGISALLPAHELGDAINIFVPITAELTPCTWQTFCRHVLN